jgi:hypothetical protein
MTLNLDHLSPQWQRTIKELATVAPQLEFGDITIRVQNRVPNLAEYTIKRKPDDVNKFQVVALGD